MRAVQDTMALWVFPAPVAAVTTIRLGAAPADTVTVYSAVAGDPSWDKMLCCTMVTTFAASVTTRAWIRKLLASERLFRAMVTSRMTV